jgi:multisubunit Na+/H+ antiporter MnhG subunit
MRDAIATALLLAGVAVQVLGCLGVLLMRRPLDRLHYVGVGVPAALCVGAAVLVQESFSLIGTKAIALALVVLVAWPAVSQATARALHPREPRE